jgi:hypothetical protein
MCSTEYSRASSKFFNICDNVTGSAVAGLHEFFMMHAARDTVAVKVIEHI